MSVSPSFAQRSPEPLAATPLLEPPYPQQSRAQVAPVTAALAARAHQCPCPEPLPRLHRRHQPCPALPSLPCRALSQRHCSCRHEATPVRALTQISQLCPGPVPPRFPSSEPLQPAPLLCRALIHLGQLSPGLALFCSHYPAPVSFSDYSHGSYQRWVPPQASGQVQHSRVGEASPSSSFSSRASP